MPLSGKRRVAIFQITLRHNHQSSSGWCRLKQACPLHRSIENCWCSVLEQVMTHGHIERACCCSMKIKWILNFEWTRIMDWCSTNLKKMEIFYLNSFNSYEYNTDSIWPNFCQFYLVHNIFQNIRIHVFNHGRSIGNTYFTTYQAFFYSNITTNNCKI